MIYTEPLESNTQGNYMGTLPAIENSKTQVSSNDCVMVRQMWKHPVFNNHEVNLFFNALEDDALTVGFALMLVTAQRPVESVATRWNKFTFDEEKMRFISLKHYTYKASNRITKRGKHVYFKEINKEIYSKSPWLNQLLIKYRNNAPEYEGQRLFPFTVTDSYNKCFHNLRKKAKESLLPPAYKCFLEKPVKIVKGKGGTTQHRLNSYAFRRFAISFLYWSKKPIGFDQDVIALSKYVGHSNPETTLKHYIFPKEVIGLTQQMIDRKITIDQFIYFYGKDQSRLEDYIPKKKIKFVPRGQSRISDYFGDEK